MRAGTRSTKQRKNRCFKVMKKRKTPSGNRVWVETLKVRGELMVKNTHEIRIKI